MNNNLPMLIQSSTIVNNRLKPTLLIHLWASQLPNSQINLREQLDLMVPNTVVEEVAIEEVSVVVRTEEVEEVSRLVVVKGNLDNLIDQTLAEEKAITKVR